MLDGDKPFYRNYVCADGKLIAVGALEPNFFEALWKGLALGDVPDHMNSANWPQIRTRLAATFRTRPRDEWAALFQGTDACVTPVLDPDEIWNDAHISSRHPSSGPRNVPAIPRLSRSPASARPYDFTDQTGAILRELGLTKRRSAHWFRTVLLPPSSGRRRCDHEPPSSQLPFGQRCRGAAR
jgi:alpha-methylacyl-CoA racemase